MANSTDSRCRSCLRFVCCKHFAADFGSSWKMAKKTRSISLPCSAVDRHLPVTETGNVQILITLPTYKGFVVSSRTVAGLQHWFEFIYVADVLQLLQRVQTLIVGVFGNDYCKQIGNGLFNVGTIIAKCQKVENLLEEIFLSYVVIWHDFINGLHELLSIDSNVSRRCRRIEQQRFHAGRDVLICFAESREVYHAAIEQFHAIVKNYLVRLSFVFGPLAQPHGIDEIRLTLL